MGLIQVYEHETILVGETRNGVSFEQKHYVSLSERLGKKSDTVFPYYSLIKHHRQDGIRFKQYVGAIQADDLTIEILPKTDKGYEDQDWKSVLLYMLGKVHRLNITAESCAPQKLRTSTILDFVILRFLNEVESVVHQGLVKTYRYQSKNLTSLKGRLLFSKHLTKNLIHQERFYVQHVTYDNSHVMNCIIKQALSCVAESSANLALRQKACQFLTMFDEVPNIVIDEKLFSTLSFDRKTERYKEAISLSELIVFNNMPNLSSGKKNTFAMMFDMNRLWEEFIYRTLKTNLSGQYIVGAQVRKRFWEAKVIRPDIVIRDANDPERFFVLDTKWKQPKNMMPSDVDLHQMYVYYKYFNAEKVALLYPSSDSADISKQSIYVGSFIDQERGSCDLIYLPVPKWSVNTKEWQQTIVSTIVGWLNS